MTTQISPGVYVTEVDLTTVVPSVQTTSGGFVGNFTWGPANKIMLIDNEITLSKTFGKPDSNTAVSFFTAANFLAYGNNLKLVRTVNANTFNATSNAVVQIENEDVYETVIMNTSNNNAYGSFVARYPGRLGNALKVSVCDTSASFSTWDYKGYFTSAPGTSAYASSVNGANDEMHIVVLDSTGEISGTANTVLETYAFVSKASDATIEGSTNYYKQVIFNKSSYVYVVDAVDYANTNATWGKTAAGRTFASLLSAPTITLTGGVDTATGDNNFALAYDLFSNKDVVDISLMLTGNANTTIQQYVIDNVAENRKDCIAFVSPPQSAVVNNAGDENTDIASWLSTLARTSSYVVADSGWKYQFDKYNNVYRWIPLNGDIAGLCVRTDNTRDPWYSPAGFNRGAIKNCIKLAWNPTKTNRDELYGAGVNPVVSFPGQGVVLYGDKTLLNKPNAFDRINVRRLFIVLEKAIAKAAQSSLFELNDEFTRAQFVASITPFLRDVQGRNGITDFRVVCDTTNNTPQVISSNRFVGDIYIKPARSINYISLNFVAVGTGVDFTTVVGA